MIKSNGREETPGPMHEAREIPTSTELGLPDNLPPHFSDASLHRVVTASNPETGDDSFERHLEIRSKSFCLGDSARVAGTQELLALELSARFRGVRPVD